jgi:HAMP domain-containing protein
MRQIMNYEYIALGAAGLSVLLLFMWVWLFVRISRLDSLRQEFYDGSVTAKVDDVIAHHHQSIKKIDEHLGELDQFVNGLATINKKNFQKVGFVRFNPFDDAGGSISFTLALLDEDDNGFVISSLHGREGNRVYAKEVKKGLSKTPLTEEEKNAIKEAK